MTSHLSGLNSIDQVDSHSSSLCRSNCKVSEFDLELIVRCAIVSSAISASERVRQIISICKK